MRIHRFAVIAAVVLVTPLLLSGCNGFCTGQPPSILCPDNPPEGDGAGFGCQGSPGENLWACNVDSSLGTPLPGISPPAPGMCGVVWCAKDEADAKQEAAALTGVSAGDARLQCISLGATVISVSSNETQATKTFNAPGAACVHKEGSGCNPCDNGEGGTLQGPGEHCGGPVTCCQGLTCVGAMASTMGTCQGTLAPCSTPDAGAGLKRCADLGEICDTLPCCPRPEGPSAPLECRPFAGARHCCAGPYTHCYATADCCAGSCSGGTCVCAEIGQGCLYDTDCCGYLGGAGAVRCSQALGGVCQ